MQAICSVEIPAVAQERVTRGPDGLVRITLKKPFSDGTVAVDLDPLSLLSRLAASVPAPRLHLPRRALVRAGEKPFVTRACLRRRVSYGPVSRRSRRLLQDPCPRARAEAAIVCGRSFSREHSGSTC